MRSLLLLFLLAFAGNKENRYTEAITQHRQHYKEEFITNKNSPLKAADTSYLRFYTPDEKYKVTAEVILTKEAQPFKIKTHTQKEKDYKEYAVLKFRLKEKDLVLHAYQMVNWEKVESHKDLLFIPFTDETNNKETYGGGRYIDLSIKDIKDNKIELDFNKCYNPYCAFAEGYSCPIPPRENSLDLAIKAGEKLFGKEVK